MAWQLIYTSSPRLLQAGRTGFGTVAKHPAIRNAVQSELERFSQFSRIEGLRSDRTLFYHRVLSIQGETYHVITRLKDAGFDYTGRTNHVAHHIVVSSAEAATAGSQGLTPVDVIANLNHQGLWRESWDESPRELSAEEEIPLAGMGKTLTLPAENWHTKSGSAANAAILAPGRVAESCWLLCPPGTSDELLPLMGESLLLHPQPWRISFATEVQPTDRIEEIVWRGVPSDSPVRATAAQSVRPTLDFENPSALPVPVPEFASLAENGVPAPSIPSPQPSPESMGSIRTSVTVGPSSPGDSDNQTASPHFASAHDGSTNLQGIPSSKKLSDLKNPKTTKTPTRFRTTWLVAILAVGLFIAAGISGYFWYDNVQRAESAKKIAAAYDALNHFLASPLPPLVISGETGTSKLKNAVATLPDPENRIASLDDAAKAAKNLKEQFEGDLLYNSLNLLHQTLKKETIRVDFHHQLAEGKWNKLFDSPIAEKEEVALLVALKELKATPANNPEKLNAIKQVLLVAQEADLSPAEKDELDQMMTKALDAATRLVLKPKDTAPPEKGQLQAAQENVEKLLAMQNLEGFPELRENLQKLKIDLASLTLSNATAAKQPKEYLPGAPAADHTSQSSSSADSKNPKELIEQSDSSAPCVKIFRTKGATLAYLDELKNSSGAIDYLELESKSVLEYALGAKSPPSPPSHYNSSFKKEFGEPSGGSKPLRIQSADGITIREYIFIAGPSGQVRLNLANAESSLTYDKEHKKILLSKPLIALLKDRIKLLDGRDAEALAFKWKIDADTDRQKSSSRSVAEGTLDLGQKDRKLIDLLPLSQKAADEHNSTSESKDKNKLTPERKAELEKSAKPITDLWMTAGAASPAVGAPDNMQEVISKYEKSLSNSDKIKDNMGSDLVTASNAFALKNIKFSEMALKAASALDGKPAPFLPAIQDTNATKAIDSLMLAAKEEADSKVAAPQPNPKRDEATRIIALLSSPTEIFNHLTLIGSDTSGPVLEIKFSAK